MRVTTAFAAEYGDVLCAIDQGDKSVQVRVRGAKQGRRRNRDRPRFGSYIGGRHVARQRDDCRTLFCNRRHNRCSDDSSGLFWINDAPNVKGGCIEEPIWIEL